MAYNTVAGVCFQTVISLFIDLAVFDVNPKIALITFYGLVVVTNRFRA